jgi:hypothetical protein
MVLIEKDFANLCIKYLKLCPQPKHAVKWLYNVLGLFVVVIVKGSDSFHGW